MLFYDIYLYNGTTEHILMLPERRRNKDRRGRYTILKWIKSIMGDDWYRTNQNRIGIASVYRRDMPEEEMIYT